MDMEGAASGLEDMEGGVKIVYVYTGGDELVVVVRR